MKYIRPVLHRFLPSAGGDILREGAPSMFLHNPELLRLPSIQAEVNSAPDHAGAGHVSGAMEDNRLEDDEYLRNPAVLTNSHELRGKRAYHCCQDHRKNSVYKYFLLWSINIPCPFLLDCCLTDE